MNATKSTITAAQRAAYFRAFSAACQNLGLTGREEREEYRKAAMLEACGKEHLRELNRTTDFDKVMAKYTADSGDWQAASKYAIGDTYRLAVMVKICCSQVMQLKGIPVGSDAAQKYLAGILRQSRISCGRSADNSSFWMDVPKASLASVFMMLDTHRRRLLAGYSSVGGLLKSFDASIVYQPRENGGIRISFNKDFYDSYSAVKINVQEVA